jgi:hypothetical protein
MPPEQANLKGACPKTITFVSEILGIKALADTLDFMKVVSGDLRSCLSAT